MNKIKLIFAVLTALLLTSTAASFVSAATVPTFTLSQTSTYLQYNLPAGTVFNGSVQTDGAVRVWANGPNGTEVADLGIISQTTAFGFTAQQNGTYTINFDNDFPNYVDVTFSYTTNPAIPGSGSSTSEIYIIATIAIAVVGSMLIVLIIRRREKRLALRRAQRVEAAKAESAKP